jgi:hypothetical protein
MNAEEKKRFWNKIIEKSSFLVDISDRIEEKEELDPSDATVISIPVPNVGLGNLRVVYGLFMWLTEIYREEKNLVIFPEFAEVSGLEKTISEIFFVRKHKEMAKKPDNNYNTREGYEKQRGITGWRNNALLIFLDSVFHTYAEKIEMLGKKCKQTIIVSAHEFPIIYLENKLKIDNFGIIITDTLLKPGYGLMDDIKFTIANEEFCERRNINSDAAQENSCRLDVINTMYKNQVAAATLLPPNFCIDRHEYFAAKKKDIEEIVKNYEGVKDISECLANPQSPIKISILPSGSGMPTVDVKAIIKQLAPYINKGIISISWLGTQEGLVDLIKKECEHYKIKVNYYSTDGADENTYFAAKAINIISNNNETAKDKIALIDCSYEMLRRAHLNISMPGEQPQFAAQFGTYSFTISERGYNEVVNTKHYQENGISQPLKLEDIAQNILGLFIDGEKRPAILDKLENFEKKGCNEPYKSPREQLKQLFNWMIK